MINSWISLFEVVCISVLPISLIRLGIIKAKYRLILLVLVCSIILYVLVHEQWNFKTLGLGIPFSIESIVSYGALTLFGILFLRGLAYVLKQKKVTDWHMDPHFVFLFIPISIAQQFIFQVFILTKLEYAFLNVPLAITSTALLFGFMHTIYPRPLLSMFLGFLAGICFALLFSLYPNIIEASISHAILNFTAVYFSFFTFLTREGKVQKTELHLR